MNDRAKRIKNIISFIMRVIIVLAIIGAIQNRNYIVLFIASLTLILTFLPAIIERNINIHLPGEIEILVIVFIFLSLFLGEIHDYYTRLWWWDFLLHTSSGIALGFAGFLLLFFLHDEHKLRAKPITIAFLSFCFALAIGALWEIFEFTMDKNLGTSMQKGLDDTMWDLIADAAGALFTSIIGFIYLKGGKTRIFDRLVDRFQRANRSYYSHRMKTE